MAGEIEELCREVGLREDRGPVVKERVEPAHGRRVIGVEHGRREHRLHVLEVGEPSSERRVRDGAGINGVEHHRGVHESGQATGPGDRLLEAVERIDLPRIDQHVLGQELSELHIGQSANCPVRIWKRGHEVHRHQRPGERVGRLAVASLAMQRDEQSLPEADLFAVQVQEVVVTPAVLKRLLQPAAGHTLIILSVADIERHALFRKVSPSTEPITGQLRSFEQRPIERRSRRQLGKRCRGNSTRGECKQHADG